MKQHLYLTMLPETLTASMLPPKKFGTYLAVGSQQKLPRESIFFSLDQDFQSDAFDFELMKKSCVPHKNGSQKKSLYLSVYRVLEHIPLSAIKNLFLVTRDGRVLELPQGEIIETAKSKFCLYSEIAPTTPLVVSKMQPKEFTSFITTDGHALHIPKICFMEMAPPSLEEEPGSRNIFSINDHIIEGYRSLDKNKKQVKIVDRRHQIEGWGRNIKGGFYLGDQNDLLFFPFPSDEELKKKHYEWYKSANL